MQNIIPKLHSKWQYRYLAMLSGTILLILTCGLILSYTLMASGSKKGAAKKATTKSQNFGKAENVLKSDEMRAVWISFLEYGSKKYTKSQFQNYINKTFDNCRAKGLNTVIVHVRPFADAIYPSKYFPWSRYISGTAGSNPGFDPLDYAVKAAHKRGLAIHAWINPYRITNDSTKLSSLPKNSIARKWGSSKNASDRRNVLKYQGKLYFNPASSAVQTLVTNGVTEIVQNYAVDGIHFDDYFYPNLGKKYKKNFDAKEYQAYVKSCKKNGKKAASIVSWRRNNVSGLLKRIHTAVKKINSKCVFGISPAGNLDNLYSSSNYYADVKTWMNSDQYIDYICPQIYWSFTQSICPYKKTLKKWTALPRNSKVDLYVGLAAYRAGISQKEASAVADIGWSKSNTILSRQVKYLRQTKKCGGFILFSYSDLNRRTARKEIRNLQKLLK